MNGSSRKTAQDLNGFVRFFYKNRSNRSKLAQKLLKPFKSWTIFEHELDPCDHQQTIKDRRTGEKSVFSVRVSFWSSQLMRMASVWDMTALEDLLGLDDFEPLHGFAWIFWLIWKWNLLSSLFLFVFAALIATCTLRRHRYARFFYSQNFLPLTLPLSFSKSVFTGLNTLHAMTWFLYQK